MAATPETARALDDPVFARSVHVLKAGQSPSGALIASPDFGVYRYAWLRDGAFCAHALDLLGEREASARWHAWVAHAVDSHGATFADATRRARAGDAPSPDEMPPTRYTLDGTLETESGDREPWPNFQLDGYGMWLWSLRAHLEGRSLPSELRSAVQLVAEYLAAGALLECWNWWEEFDGGRHASTLAALAAGLDAAAALAGDEEHAAAAERVKAELVAHYTVDGRFRRGANDDRVDGSLLSLSIPFNVFGNDDPRVAATVAAVRSDLVGPGGGVYRFLGDTYYGGGQWLLLTSWLAWHDTVAGAGDVAARSQEWVRGQALPNGDLPEQVGTNAQDASMIAPWVERWGPVATPLLWSHAMYVIAEQARR